MSRRKNEMESRIYQTFLKEPAQLPKEIQSRGEEIAFKELPSENPFEIGYAEQMTGYRD